MTTTGAQQVRMHKILCRNTLDQGLFFFVQGAIRGNPQISVTMAVIDFCETYALPAEYEHMRRKYYRLLEEYRTDHTDFRENLKFTVDAK